MLARSDTSFTAWIPNGMRDRLVVVQYQDRRVAVDFRASRREAEAQVCYECGTRVSVLAWGKEDKARRTAV